MGGNIFHLFDFHQGSSMARKILGKKKHVDGLEAPRNSLELQLDASQSYYTAGEFPCSYQVEEDWEARNYYQNEASMKNLISEEISKQSNTRHNNGPSIVAKLMGMDPFPLYTKSVVQPVVKKNNNQRVEFSKREKNAKGSNSNYSKQMEVDSIYSRRDRDAERWNTDVKLGKPRPREHPQEEELQRFKKDFEAWRVARLRECSKVIDLGMHGKPLESNRNAVKEKGLHHHRHKSEHFTAEQNEPRTRNMIKDYNEKLDAAPTRIVILKPGPDSICDHEESWTSSSSTFQERASMKDFLEEVRERLKSELQGKALNSKNKSYVVRGSGIETPFREMPSSDPRQIAKHITNQVSENVSRDLGMNLVRSESTRSYRSEVQFNGLGSPEFINKDTRRFLSDRLRNVLKQETHLDVPTISNGSSRSSSCDNGHDVRLLNKEPSPINLIRSLSAPVSGTSFKKLLLEDRHVLTGAQIRTKHEGIEPNTSVEIRRRKKEKFNLKEKVSNIKYSWTLRRRLFGKKIQSMTESYSTAGNDLARDILSGTTVMMNFGERHENSTEVPPSLASVCSTTHEEFWREVDYHSPLSTPDVTLGEDNDVPQVFKEISSNLKELRRQLNELESYGADDVTIKQEPIEYEVNVEDRGHEFVRDLLVASGLFDGSCDKSFSRWDPLAKPISKSVFEQVGERYRKSTKENDKMVVDHKVLLDLSNEALSIILGPHVTMSRFKRKLLGSTILTRPQGRKLLNSVWEIVHFNLYPPNDRCNYSLDDMVTGDLRSTPWTGLVDDETNVLGREVECHIIGDLVEEIVKDMSSLRLLL